MRHFFVCLVGAAIVTLFLIAIVQAHSAPLAGEAPAWNPSDVPPWGTGPNPNGPATNVPAAPTPVTPAPIPAAPALTPPNGTDKFLLYKTDGSNPADVTDKVYVFTDQHTGSQFLIFILPGQPPVMVKR